LQNSSPTNVDDLNNVERETSRNFRNKKTEYLKEETNKLETNSKSKNTQDLYRNINEVKTSYQPNTK